jgi:WD40 repeat protein
LKNKLIAAGCEKDTILIWDNTGLKHSIKPGIGRVFSIDTPGHGEWFVVGGENGSIHTYSSSTFDLISNTSLGLQELFWVTITNSEENIVVSFADGDISVLKVSESGQLSPKFGPCRIAAKIDEHNKRNTEIKPFLNE